MTQKVIFAITFQISLTNLVVLKMTPENFLLFDWPVLVNMIRFII